MGDISELRGIVTVVSFLGILVFLLFMVPSELYSASSMREVDVPDQWEGIDMHSFAETWNSTNIYVKIENFDIGGRNLRWLSDFSGDFLCLQHRYGFLLLYAESGEWYNRKGILVSDLEGYPIDQQKIHATQLDTEYSTYGDMRFVIKFHAEAHFQVSTFFTFNETTYSKPSDAWENDALNVLVGINFDAINTAFNAWQLISMLLFFQLPMIHWILNAIIAIPIYTSVAYLGYVLIIKVIPLIAGG